MAVGSSQKGGFLMPYKEGKKWRGKVTHQGQRYTKIKDTKTAAIEWEVQKKKELKIPEKPLPSKLDLLSFCSEYLIHAKKFNIKTYQEKSGLCKRLLQNWGKDINVCEITPRMAQQYLDKQFSTRSGNAANKDRKNLKRLFNWGIELEIIYHNPVSKIEIYPHQRKPTYTPPVEDVLRLLAVTTRSERNFLDCILQTGARKSEIFHLTWDDINLKAKTIRLWNMKGKGGTMKERTLAMSDELYNSLWWHWNNRKFKRSPYVFIDDQKGPHYGKPYKSRRRFMAGLCKRAGIRSFGFHALRRFVASVLDSKNVPLKQIQIVLGHSTTAITDRYVSNLQTDMKSTMNLLQIEKAHEDGERHENNKEREVKK